MTARDLVPRLDLAVDFGAVHEGHPINRSVEITRPAVLSRVATTVRESAESGATVVLSGGPGAGKTWLCEQLAGELRGVCIVARHHHRWLGAADTQRNRRVLTEVVVGSLLQQLEAAAPEAVATAQACTACADACLSEDMVAELTECIRTNADCADVCDATGRVLSRHTGYNANLTRAVLEACAAACKACGDECERHAEMHEHCRVCAEPCRRCEAACRELLSSLG